MTIQNPFSGDGSFSAVDRFGVFDEELRRTEKVLTGWVNAGRMKRSSYEHKIGAMRSILEKLRAEMVEEQANACAWVGNDKNIECLSCKLTYEFRQRQPECPRKEAVASEHWPAGCIKPGSCSRHKACMYAMSSEVCRHFGKDLTAEVKAAQHDREFEAAKPIWEGR